MSEGWFYVLCIAVGTIAALLVDGGGSSNRQRKEYLKDGWKIELLNEVKALHAEIRNRDKE
jgi:hypothetical protein